MNEKMISLQNLPSLIFYLTKITSCHPKFFYHLLLVNYVCNKLQALLKMQLSLRCTPDAYFSSLITIYGKCSKNQVDENLYILCNPRDFETTGKWSYLCCRSATKKYKVVVVPSDKVLQNCIYISESLKFNVRRFLGVGESVASSYFLFPAQNIETIYAEEVKISLISSPHGCTDENMNSLLQKFFSTPRYMRLHDTFRINFQEFFPEIMYCSADSKSKVLHFKVNSLRIRPESRDSKDAFVLYGKTTLIQESNTNDFLPQKCFCDVILGKEKLYGSDWPLSLRKPIQQLQECIAPFVIKNSPIGLKPILSLVGPAGSGKSQLAKAVAKMLGLHYSVADFCDVQSLTSAQTEAKFRIILNDAEKSIPCMLILRNIQIFGINSEGQKDERVISAFATELDRLYRKKLKFPLIIVATSTDSEIPVDTKSIFIEKIVMNKLNQDERCEILSWFIKRKGLEHQVDLPKTAKMCSDFVLADLKALILHAIRGRFKKFSQQKQSGGMILLDEDIMDAYEHMKAALSQEIGVPSVPKVHWDDIGGLADLKHEIMRRIQMPLLNIPGMGRSGLLLYGPPGTGKTLLAKAVATECQLHFLSVKGPELLNMYVGQSEKNVRQVFERARAAAPCIIFFDELDSLAPNRGQSGDSGGVMDRVVSQLLAEMDGLGSSGDVSIIAATNRPDLIDPALLRPGRFDKMLYVGIYSDTESQKSVLRALTKRFILERDGQELDELVSKLPINLTGADLYSVCSNAWLKAVRRILVENEADREKLCERDVVVKLEDFVKASEELVPSVSEEELTRYEKLQKELSSR